MKWSASQRNAQIISSKFRARPNPMQTTKLHKPIEQVKYLRRFLFGAIALRMMKEGLDTLSGAKGSARFLSFRRFFSSRGAL
jgi:hypothetical protein